MIYALIEQRNAAIVADVTDGMPVPEAAAKHKISVGHALNILRAAGVRSRPPGPNVVLTPEVISAVKVLALKGMTRQQISDTLKISYPYTCLAIKRHGIKVKRKPHERTVSGRASRGHRRPPTGYLAVKVLGWLYERAKQGVDFTFSECADVFQVSREYVGQVWRAAVDAKILPGPADQGRLAA